MKCWNFFLFFLVGLAFFPTNTCADTVTTGAGAPVRVLVREHPRAHNSEVLGFLEMNDRAELLFSIPNWHRVRLANGVEGFVFMREARVDHDNDYGGNDSPSFDVHFVDVGMGDGTVFNMGEKEMVVDGGNYTALFHDYVKQTGIIDGPVELVVLTHAAYDHWAGLSRLFNFDHKGSALHKPLEFWEPGFARKCSPLQGYNQFIQRMRAVVSADRFLRPLQEHRAPASLSGRNEPFTVDSLPGMTFTLIHADSDPWDGDCSTRIHNASIVMKVEISGVSFLMTGDARGRDPVMGSAISVEKKLLELERMYPGILKADVLKVPAHGGDVASSDEFIAAVDPRYVIIFSSPRDHLPRPSVIRRLENGDRVVLRTDMNRAENNDHILCTSSTYGQVECNYLDQF